MMMGHDDYRWASWSFVVGWDKWGSVKLGIREFGDDLRFFGLFGIDRTHA